MGVDFTAVIDHRLTEADLVTLPERLNTGWELPSCLRPWVQKYVRAGSTKWEWKHSLPEAPLIWDSLEDRSISLDGPHGFHARVCRRAFHFVHLARWWSFLYEDDVHLGLEESCRNLARLIGAEHILYLPDSLARPSLATEVFYEGGTVDDALRWLHATVGAPVQSKTALPGPDADDPYGSIWFYERTGRTVVSSADRQAH